MQLAPEADPTLVLALEGVFDTLAARRVEAVLATAAADLTVRVDLSRVREFHDLGIAVLAHAIGRSPARVEVRGLRRHQLRVLRYFGVDAATAPMGGAADAG